MDLWLQILLIAIGISIFSQFFSRLLGIDPKKTAALQKQLRELYPKITEAQQRSVSGIQVGEGDNTEYQQLQRELVSLMKQIAKKQFLPMGLQCVTFWVIYAILIFIFGSIYGYTVPVLPFNVLWFSNGFTAAYFLYSFCLNIIIYAIRRLYNKLRGQPQSNVVESPSANFSDDTSIIEASNPWKSRLAALKLGGEIQELQEFQDPADSIE